MAGQSRNRQMYTRYVIIQDYDCLALKISKTAKTNVIFIKG